MLASVPSQHLESDYRPRRNPKCESTSIDHALERDDIRLNRFLGFHDAGAI
jgi:hypothetical protein